MPTPSVSALAEPIRALLAMVGPGWPAGSHPAESLVAVRDHAAAAAARATASWAMTSTGWAGTAAAAALDSTGATVAALDELGSRAARLGVAAASASDAVTRVRARLQRILDDFETYAATVDEDAAGSRDALAAAAQRALDEATAVVDQLRTELDEHATAVADPTSGATAAASVAPSGFGGPMTWGGAGAVPAALGAAAGWGSTSGATTSGTTTSGASNLGGTTSGASNPAATASGATASGAARPHGPHDVGPSPDPGSFGNGVTIALPDGSTATAPNASAASAVRNALTQLGVPYRWGGTAPGVGLDCSGLTQWAYREAGVDLPRLAQEQDVGAAIAQSALRPGDLAVWDGHVAMIVGNGTMIEAGDPVHLSAIRTTNAGQGFQGFWRPTA